MHSQNNTLSNAKANRVQLDIGYLYDDNNNAVFTAILYGMLLRSLVNR